MTRYQFELLAYIEKHGTKDYSIRELADNLCISGTKVMECIEDARSRDWIEKGEQRFRITEAGLTALEPYRVKRAIILAAGFGSRMMPATADRPKPMVTVNGVRIIDTLLDALVNVGITDIMLVRGYKKEKFDDLSEKYPFLQFTDNDQYDTTNNISSVMLTLGKLNGGCYLCEADLYISNPDVITKYQYCSNILGSYSLETDDWSYRLRDGFASEYQKGNTYCYNYYGISYWTEEDCSKLRKDFSDVWEGPEGHDYFWEFIPLVLCKDHYNVEIRQCRKQDIMEIDNYYELAQLDPTYTSEEKW